MVLTKIQYTDGTIRTVDLPSTYEVGTILAVTDLADGGVIAGRVTPFTAGPGICQSHDMGSHTDGISYFSFYVKASGSLGPSQSVKLTIYTTNLGDIVWEPETVPLEWTKITLGPFENIYQTSIKMELIGSGAAIYFDNLYFSWMDESGIWDIGGNGGFETGTTYWTLTGDAEITSDEAYEGTHSLKL